MKFALNGALTIGTDDGANIEIRELVGDDHFFLFGLLEPEVEALYSKGYVPSSYYESDENLRRAIDLIAQGAFSGGDRDAYASVVGNLLYEDRFMALADYASYLEAQDQVDAAYADTDTWTKSAILNVARSGFFSSDRSMREYIDRIWHTPPAF
jgi:glycogen phosphorylase